VAFIDVSQLPLGPVSEEEPEGRDTRANDAADLLARASEAEEVELRKGRTLYFPAVGSPYKIVRTLHVAAPGTQLIGQGPEGTVLRYTRTDDPVAVAINSGDQGLLTQQFAIRDLAIKGGEDIDPTLVTDDPKELAEPETRKLSHADTLASHPHIGIEIGGAGGGRRSASGLLDNVKVEGFRDAGIRVVGTAGISFQHVVFQFNGIGFLAESEDYQEGNYWRRSAINGNQFYGCNFLRHSDHGVKLSGIANGNSFYGCRFENNQREGVWLFTRPSDESRLLRDALDANGFYNCWFEANRGAHVKVDTAIGGIPVDIHSLVILNCVFNQLAKLWENAPRGSPPHILLDGHVDNAMIGPNAHRDPGAGSGLDSHRHHLSPYVGVHTAASGSAIAAGSISNTGWKVWAADDPSQGGWKDWSDPRAQPWRRIEVYWVGFTPPGGS
jgi:hypothetical protein